MNVGTTSLNTTIRPYRVYFCKVIRTTTEAVRIPDIRRNERMEKIRREGGGKYAKNKELRKGDKKYDQNK